jgi:GR25 family glycosyltransferase involved in LPS biosynthesis
MKINDVFDGVFVINLDRRIDRLIHITQQLGKFGIIFEKFSAVDGNLLNDVSRELHKNILACGLSHLEIIKIAKQRKLKNVLIFEDDAVLRDDFLSVFERNISSVPNDWSMLYFGGNHLGGLDKISDEIYRLKYSYAAHAYVLNANIYDLLIENIPKITKPFDALYAELHRILPCYLIKTDTGQITWQLPNYSDINNRFENYDYVLK